MIRILENLLPKSNQLKIPTIPTGASTQSEIVGGVLHVWEQSEYIVNIIPYESVDLDPSKTYCLGFFGEIISGEYGLWGISPIYVSTSSSNGAHYMTASGATKLNEIHVQTSSDDGSGEVYIKSLFLVEGDKPPSIWTPAHADLTAEQIATLPPYGEYKEIQAF